jgi:hypothetical protein
MPYFHSIRKTQHYREHHEHEVPWHTVVELIFATKNPRKKGDAFEIERNGLYVVFSIQDGVLSVINAKRTQ